MREGWQIKTLGEVLQKAETIKPLQTPEAEFDYIDVSSVSNSTFKIEATQRLKGKNAPSRARRRVKARDVLFATVRPTLRRIAIVPEYLDNQVCSTGYFVLRAKAGVDYRFVFYSLFTKDFMEQMEKLQKGASYPAVTDGEVRAQKIPLPPLPEQKRIVAILDEAFAGIATAVANTEKNLANARGLFESYLNNVFTQKGDGWVDGKIGDVCETQYGISGKMNTERRGYKIFRMGEVQRGRLVDTGSMKHISLDASEFKKYQLHNGDVLFNRTNSSELVGKTGIFNEDGDYCFASYLIRLLLDKEKMNEEFICYLMNSQIFLNRIRKKASKSVNQANINATILRNEPISYPNSLIKQSEIVGKLNSLNTQTNRLESLYQHKLTTLAELKQSLLHKAFSGALTAQPERALQEAVA